jgi:hypothetical protein
MAAVQMLENSMDDVGRERRLRSIAPDDLVQAENLAPKASFSPGYQDRVLYLLWLHEKMNVGIGFSNITADEADGIAAVLRGRQQFEAEHPRCPGCGYRMKFTKMKRCPNCSRELC